MKKQQQVAMAGVRGGTQATIAFRRGPAGTRNKWERQADDAAHRMLRGEHNLARRLTPAPAASFMMAWSAGSPLPLRVKERLEEGFGADLSQVRIHIDAAAAAGARAFTSGSHIYFSAGAFEPDSAGGRWLIAHEVSHVLQQTGRSDSSGQLRATDIAGPGEVQCKENENVELSAGSDFFDAPSGWDEIKRAYADIPESATHIAVIEAHLTAKLPLDAAELAALALPTAAAGFKNLPSQIKGLYVDALKLAGGYRSAREILVTDPSIPTAFRSRAFYEYVRAHSLEWIGMVAATDRFAKTYYPERIVAAYAAPLLPRDLKTADGKKLVQTIQSELLVELDAIRATNGLRDNELRMMMLLALSHLDVAKSDGLHLPYDARSSHPDVSEQYARAIVRALSASRPKESQALVTAAAPQIKSLAIQAAKSWKHTLTSRKTVTGQDGHVRPAVKPTPKAKTDKHPSAGARGGVRARQKPTHKAGQKTGSKAEAETQVDKALPQASATEDKKPARPEDDPGFQAVVQQTRVKSKHEGKAHKTPGKKSDEVEAGAQLPIEARRKEKTSEEHLQKMEAVPPPKVEDLTVAGFTDKFRAKVDEIASKLPKEKEEQGTLTKAVELAAERVAMIQHVRIQNDTLSEPLRGAVKNPPEFKDKLSNPPVLTVDPAGTTPKIKDAKAAAPKPKPDEQVSMDDQSRALDDALTNHNVGGQKLDIKESSLAFPVSGEKDFDEAGESKRKAQEEIRKFFPRYRGEEEKVIAQSEIAIPHVVNSGLTDEHKKRSDTFGGVLAVQGKQQDKIKGDKQDVFTHFQRIYENTKKLVAAELQSLENVGTDFEAVLNKAEENFKDWVHDQLDYIYTPGFLDYSNWKSVNASEIKEEYQRLQSATDNDTPRYFPVDPLYFQAMDNVRDKHAKIAFEYAKDQFVRDVLSGVETIAATVVAALNRASEHIRHGSAESKTIYDGLDDDQKKEVRAAYDAVNLQYQTLEDSVKDQEREIVDDMARSYSRSAGKLKATFDQIKEDVLTSWIKRAWKKLKAVINAIIDFASRIVQLLGRIAYLVGDIVTSPRKFFRTLAAGIGEGFSTFAKDIDQYLATAFFDWLRGSSGHLVQMPKEWDAEGIFSLFTQLLDVGTETIWERMEIVYDKTIANAFRKGEVLLDKGLEVFATIKTEGLGGFWTHIKESLGSILEDTVGMIKESVLYAAIKKVLVDIGKLLVPGGGFIAIAEKVIRLLEFIVEARDKILDLIESFVNSMELAVKGDVAGIVRRITGALTKFITVALDFLVTFFGLGELKEKVERFIQKMRTPIIRGIDFVLVKFRPIVMKGKEFLVKGKEKVVAAGKKVTLAVGGWLMRVLGIEKRFKGDDGLSHRLYFAERAGSAVLMINPAPATDFATWVAHLDSGSEERRGKARKKAAEIIRENARPLTGNTLSERHDSEEQKAKTIRGLIDELSAITGPLFKRERPLCAQKKPELEFGTLHRGKYGISMQAKFLTNVKMPAGSAPSVSSDSFEVINQRRNQGGAYYVKGHLLNNNLGGKGNIWENLTPLTREANSAHERIAEARVKNAVDAGNIVYYAVKAKYDHKAAPRAPNSRLQGIMNEERYVPTELVCNALMVTPAAVAARGDVKGAPLVPADTRIRNTISQKSEDYDLQGVRHAKVYLDSAKETGIASIEGVDLRLAKKIREAHKDKGSHFVSIEALADYKFSDGSTFTELQKEAIRKLDTYAYVFLYSRP
jgi:hypothetical protein